jgi:hypothetical protein
MKQDCRGSMKNFCGAHRRERGAGYVERTL